jgi:hypothetical protein
LAAFPRQEPAVSFSDNPYAPPGDIKPLYAPPPPAGPPSGLANAALILGSIGLAVSWFGCCCAPIGVLGSIAGGTALVLGYLGIRDCDEQGKSGRGLAIAGMICGGLALFMGLAAITMLIVSLAANAANQRAIAP